MAAYLRNASTLPQAVPGNYDVYWEGRIIANVTASGNAVLSQLLPAIVDFNSVDGLLGIWIGAERTVDTSVSLFR